MSKSSKNPYLIVVTTSTISPHSLAIIDKVKNSLLDSNPIIYFRRQVMDFFYFEVRSKMILHFFVNFNFYFINFYLNDMIYLGV